MISITITNVNNTHEEVKNLIGYLFSVNKMIFKKEKFNGTEYIIYSEDEELFLVFCKVLIKQESLIYFFNDSYRYYDPYGEYDIYGNKIEGKEK